MMTQRRKRRPKTPKQASACAGPIDDLLDPALFKSLCDATRARLLACLIKCGRACTVTEVAECCSVDFSVVSRHLQVLERAGILSVARSGRTVTYAVRYGHLCSTLRSLADAIEHSAPADECADAPGECAGGRCAHC